MDERIQVWLLDIKRAIEEVESFFENYPMDYTVFEKDYLRRSAVERKAEIMGINQKFLGYVVSMEGRFTKSRLKRFL
ncbi:MAG: hypothetical protein J1F67_09605 [Muribaculaceae bacterium]|nr:hypothetical protein [Muribaculaceae bacterium]